MPASVPSRLNSPKTSLDLEFDQASVCVCVYVCVCVCVCVRARARVCGRQVPITVKRIQGRGNKKLGDMEYDLDIDVEW